ncbi:MAG: dienelactone hydrolase family protein [Candidatus Nanohaloarchaea archaeon]
METFGDEDAETAGILIHGRGATAKSILGLKNQIENNDIYYIAPQAEKREWYPNSFLNPIEDNQPELDQALKTVEECIEDLEAKGFEKENIFLLGFSQGACLVTEYAARNPARFKAVIGLSGGLIGPEGTDFNYSGDLNETPVFIGCSENDPHIPKSRVDETAEELEGLNAEVEKRIYEGSFHGIVDDEIDWINQNV